MDERVSTTMSDDALRARKPITIIEARPGWRLYDFREAFAYRELLYVMAARDLTLRYKQTALGAAWALLQPLAMMIVLSIVFGRIAGLPSDGAPYPVFALAGLLPWTFFANVAPTAGASLVAASNILTKVYLPRLLIPLSTAGAPLVDLAISTLLLFAVMAWHGVGLRWSQLVAPFFLLGVVIASLGVGVLLSALTVAYRDFRHVVPFLIQFWMFASPVAYPVSLVPAEWRWLYFLNPMAGMIDGFRHALIGSPPDAFGVVVSGLSALVIFCLGVAYFARVERGFADIV
ncbi:transport permease protein [Methylosinus sp. C49]|uniref:ABC transporter permease n=1 Tax=Methylosinus sp. C49 TaxID=2699395 RepID=UPI001366DFE7|nr:ABC transporter permease [Methylosinus sp. C49]BBU62386.1 transport permease protein [Methylosinus sp. C49]